MNATRIGCLLIPLFVSSLEANEALDVLEGKKKASDIVLPPPPEGSPAALAETEQEKPVYVDSGWAPSPLDPLWARATLFQDPENPYIQELAIRGFFDWRINSGDAHVTGAPDVEMDGSRTRRARLGARIRAFRNTDIEVDYEMAGSGRNSGLERLSARTEVLTDTGVTYGKFQPEIGGESRISPEFLPYPERSALTNLVVPPSTLGLRIDRKSGDWDYALGWFTGGDPDDIPEVRGDGFVTLSLGRTMVDSFEGSTQRTRWHFDYLHNFDAGRSGAIPGYDVAGRRSANGGQLVTENPAFRHLVSTGFTLERDRFKFLADFMIAKGDSSVWGLTLAPEWWAIPGTLKIVGRYHYAGSDDPGAIVAGVGSSSDLRFDDSNFLIGNEYHSFYLGANLHLYQDRMILSSGVESITFSDENGGGFDTDAWIWHTGARVSF
jgi:hypothetical protein